MNFNVGESWAGSEFQVWLQVAALLQIVFVAVAGVDAGWFHFYKYKLHLRAASAREHLLHTLNSLLFPSTILGVFVLNVRGALLWGVVSCYVLTFAIELLDVWEEKRSRPADGGLEPLESVLHFGMGLLRASVLGIFVATRSVDDFGSLLPLVKDSSLIPFWVRVMGLSMIVASVPMAFLHIVTLIRTPFWRLA